MRIQPRQQLLEIWRSVARVSAPERSAWVWGGRRGRNAISDAEQLLCLMTPSTQVKAFQLDRPDEITDDTLGVLVSLGDSVGIPRLLVRILMEYLESYTDEHGMPVFPGGDYLESTDPTRRPTELQKGVEIVDAFATSIPLCLAAIGFLREFRAVLTREDLRREVDAAEEAASLRLTAAMLGLLRSFAVHVFEVTSPEGQALCRTVNQEGLPQRRLVEQLLHELRQVKAGLRDLTIGASETADLDNPNLLFECGWSWGVVAGAPPVATTEKIPRQPDGLAQPAPYLYFTVAALDSIQGLFSERTRVLGLLNEEQHRLARTLQIRWDLAQSYWSTIASFGSGRWPLEDIPWRTTDELESDYFTLLVSSITVQTLADRTLAETELVRVGRVLDDLASRGRITRRPFTTDPAVPMHAPGIAVPLEGTEKLGGPRLSWTLADFSPQLLRRTLRVAALLRSADRRGQLLDLADDIWEHLLRRRHRTGPAQHLWDQPSEVYPEVKPLDEQPSWYFTSRVVEALVATASLMEGAPPRGPHAGQVATDLLIEAEHLFDQELLNASAEVGPALAAALQTARTTLRRAHSLLIDRPATAMVLAGDVLRELDRLAAARQGPRGTV